MHSVVHLFRHASFHAGTWCRDAHTARWHASAQASSWTVPQTVTHDDGVASRESPPMRRRRRGEAQTRSQTKVGSEGSSTGLSLLLVVWWWFGWGIGEGKKKPEVEVEKG